MALKRFVTNTADFMNRHTSVPICEVRTVARRPLKRTSQIEGHYF